MPLPSVLQSCCWKVSWKKFSFLLKAPYRNSLVHNLLIFSLYFRFPFKLQRSSLGWFEALCDSWIRSVDSLYCILYFNYYIFHVSLVLLCVSFLKLGKFSSMRSSNMSSSPISLFSAATSTAKSFQSHPTLCDPIDGSLPGSHVPGILQARTLEWVAISFSNAWKWKVKVKSLSHVRPSETPWTAAFQAPPSMGFSR